MAQLRAAHAARIRPLVPDPSRNDVPEHGRNRDIRDAQADLAVRDVRPGARDGPSVSIHGRRVLAELVHSDIRAVSRRRTDLLPEAARNGRADRGGGGSGSMSFKFLVSSFKSLARP